MSYSRKLIEPEEGVLGASHLQLVGQKQWRHDWVSGGGILWGWALTRGVWGCHWAAGARVGRRYWTGEAPTLGQESPRGPPTSLKTRTSASKCPQLRNSAPICRTVWASSCLRSLYSWSDSQRGSHPQKFKGSSLVSTNWRPLFEYFVVINNSIKNVKMTLTYAIWCDLGKI